MPEVTFHRKFLCQIADFQNDIRHLIPVSYTHLQLQAVDIEEFQEYLKVYDSAEDNRLQTNGERGLKRKMSALRSFYNYYYKREMIKTNPVLLVDMPKLHDKAIIRLDPDETAELLDYIEHAGDSLTGQKKAYYEKTRLRDLAIVTLLLGTGIRVSECVGLDVEDVDFKNDAIRVVRKGGSEMMIYFGDEVEQALLNYCLLYTSGGLQGATTVYSFFFFDVL